MKNRLDTMLPSIPGIEAHRQLSIYSQKARLKAQTENIDTAHTVTPAWKIFGIGTSVSSRKKLSCDR